MRALLPSYILHEPRDLNHALEMIGDGYKPFAGGTDLMVVFETGRLPKTPLVSLWSLESLRGIKVENDYVTLGALTTYSQIRSHEIFASEYPNLVTAARETGAIAIQNRGTIGGNIANASPAADSPPALLSYDAEIELASTAGRRWVKYEGFHTGYKTTVMKSDELISSVRLPRSRAPGLKHVYRKVGTRKAQAITKIGLAATIRLDGKTVQDVRIAFASVAPVPLRCLKTENNLRGQILSSTSIADACRVLSQEIAPIDDIRSTAAYRVTVAQNILAAALQGLG